MGPQRNAVVEGLAETVGVRRLTRGAAAPRRWALAAVRPALVGRCQRRAGVVPPAVDPRPGISAGGVRVSAGGPRVAATRGGVVIDRTSLTRAVALAVCATRLHPGRAASDACTRDLLPWHAPAARSGRVLDARVVDGPESSPGPSTTGEPERRGGEYRDGNREPRATGVHGPSLFQSSLAGMEDDDDRSLPAGRMRDGSPWGLSSGTAGPPHQGAPTFLFFA
jgi:hypothetical protein